MSKPILKFTPFNSAVDASFWQSFASKKLDVLKLSDEPQVIQGYYTAGQLAIDENKPIIIPSHFTIPSDGLSNTINVKFGSCSKGMLINTNTIEEFRNIDKNKLFHKVSEKITNSVQDGEALKDANILNSFLLLTFADLKIYKFYYWFAFPAIMPQPTPWLLNSTEELQSSYNNQLDKEYQALGNNPPYFLVKKENQTGNIQLASLSQFDNSNDNYFFGFIDPSVSNDAPGWPLRNFLYLIHKTWNKRKVKVLCYRPSQKNQLTSYILETELPETSCYDSIKSVGWERNTQGKLGPRIAELGPLMDPMKLADTSVDLNLKLMRWRAMPELDLEKIKQTKCLLFGAGTLGCYVARCLIGWGVRHITFVDGGKVSFSNPVRQPLYTFENALNGGLPKAEIAAENLMKIQPTLNATGYNISIPMPGHPASSDEQLNDQIEIISNLVQTHDVLFLLTDSRESRWYPTLLGAKMNKIVLNSALGFDTFVVMRHGSRRKHDTTKEQLGCYFCNDIVAPTDSLTDRTLDQQCTVTRPGLAAIAGALSVELMVSLLQHPEGIHAKADINQSSSILGVLPHQIRGFLGQFNNMLIVGQAYEKCTACSEKILNLYNENPSSFMKQVLKDSLYLEEITGLAAMKKESEALINDDWEEEDNSDILI
ncbi:E1-like protein-activating enzyme Gsa7p/Apg7p [Cokeromyces recurvatus]|uniref:E1-like protein-activating enzyme Gsa7p/Apg7p n=1 Tax=Cokeromyces recurvatus TaxID=90255 RepID=UPI00221FC6CD|nr:E1-like protein-activating enzyme Gsa7p/Apg7p [Cokeromyces recurvatus]KAI7903438.1 E1-like protein-activating enzyme Gsa7p/Apg7p [Cokeromyces recurvatus]